ncbi:FIG00561498: hypothetical protein [hydrothermal vent metagenome]|uniref:TIGR03790 family protein n=1 Tax=hydrothermal vent metagenome TaxID=652676 RepID=A0A3B0VQP0_9ZZZZ
MMKPTYDTIDFYMLIILKPFKYIFHIFSFALLSLLLTACTFTPSPPPIVELPQQGITSQNIGLLIKHNDQLSLQTAQLYQQARAIPDEHIFYVDLPDNANMPPKQFKILYQKLMSQAGNDIQAFVATWQAPYRVGCMSITSALAFGYDKKWCQPKKKGCFPTPNSPYFNSNSNAPWKELNMRPTMLLTGKDYKSINALIQRGVQSDGTRPKGHAYLIKTKDKARSTRAGLFKRFATHFPSHSLLKIHFLDASTPSMTDYISLKENVMFYQTGLKHVPDIHTNRYLPGAIADHLTSTGGQGLSEQGQMKAFRWLEAGATGSYGTVVEPCNFVQKFPNPEILIPRYLQGETLIEAYWKSVLQPSEGLFIGEPLAKPYNLFNVFRSGDKLTIITNQLNPNKPYQLLEWQKKKQRFIPISAQFSVTSFNNTITIHAQKANSSKYKVVELRTE